MKDFVKKHASVLYVAVFLCAVFGVFQYGQYVQKLEGGKLLEDQRVAMQAKIDDEVSRRNEIAQRFETKLENIKIVNTTIHSAVRHELEKQIYTDCQLPESGTDLINQNAIQLNNARNTK